MEPPPKKNDDESADHDNDERCIMCPITGDVMVDPVMADDGASYERQAIEQWFERCRLQNKPPTSPLTGAELRSSKLARFRWRSSA
jgi:hypothetical protein